MPRRRLASGPSLFALSNFDVIFSLSLNLFVSTVKSQVVYLGLDHAHESF